MEEEDAHTATSLDSLPPTAILDGLAESIIDMVRPVAAAHLEAYNPSIQGLVVIHRPIETEAGAGCLSILSGVNSCRVSLSRLPPALPELHPSALRQLIRRCLRRGRVNIFVTSSSVEITRHGGLNDSASSSSTASSRPSWIRSWLDRDGATALQLTRGASATLHAVVERLNAGIRGLERLFRLASEGDRSGSRVPQILGALHVLRQMAKVLASGVEKPSGISRAKRKRCSVELLVSEGEALHATRSGGNLGFENLPSSSRLMSDGFCMEELVDDDTGTMLGVAEDAEGYSEVLKKMKKLGCG